MPHVPRAAPNRSWRPIRPLVNMFFIFSYAFAEKCCGASCSSSAMWHAIASATIISMWWDDFSLASRQPRGVSMATQRLIANRISSSG